MKKEVNKMLFMPQEKSKEMVNKVHKEWEAEMKERSKKRREEYSKQIQKEKQQAANKSKEMN